MEHIHIPTRAARGYLDPEIVGAAYRESGGGCFLEGHYVERIGPGHSLPELEPDAVLPAIGDYAIRVKLASRSNLEGVWVGFPDTAEYMDVAHPDELLLGLDALEPGTEYVMFADADPGAVHCGGCGLRPAPAHKYPLPV